MCDCKNIEMGSYANQVELVPWWKTELIGIDACLKDELLFLWKKRIITTGCCCGHNKVKPMINVILEHHEKMIDLGYKFWTNNHRVLCYEPKSIIA